MAGIDLQLQRAAKQLQKSVAPGIGADIIEVWRQVTVTTEGGFARDAAGNRIRSNSETITNTSVVARYYGRYERIRGGGEQDYSAESSIVRYVFVLNAGDKPDIKGSDKLTVAIKRTVRQTIAQLGWQPGFAYSVDALEQPTDSNGRRYRRTSGTVSGDVEPTWPLTAGETVVDGDGEWLCVGAMDVYDIFDPGGPGTIPVEYVILAERKPQQVL